MMTIKVLKSSTIQNTLETMLEVQTW